ncbi:MAG: tail fiber domain-containing protein [Candidatus Saccharimonas sp.]|nr:tail fiber domain-containing protein [Planctomycetaceae bacterium]
MQITHLSSRRITVIVWGLMGICCLGTTVSAQDQTILGDLTIESDSPQLFFRDTFGAGYGWSIYPNYGSFEIFDDSTGTYPFTIFPGAVDDSFVISSEGRIGLGAFAPQTHLHCQSDGPVTFRLDDFNALTPGMWDVEGGGLGFNVKDVEAGTTPFSLLPGAPSNSLFVAVNGSIGMGTATPDPSSRLDIRSLLTNGLMAKRDDGNGHYLRVENNISAFRCGVQGINGDAQCGSLTADKGLNLLAGGSTKMVINSTGKISFGNSPLAITTAALLHTTGARLTAGGAWSNASSRSLKQDIEPITSEQARDTVRALQPVGYRYKNELDERYVGFIAEDVPELVATNDRKGLAPMDITAVLTKVVQDQQTKLEKQEAMIAALTERLEAIERANAAAPKRD